MSELLDIIDYKGTTVGFAQRDTVHRLGLRHKEITVIGVLPDQKIVFQKRSKSKKVNPGGVVTFVGGHISKGESIRDAATKEILEESGLVVDPDLLKFVGIENYYQEHSSGLVDNANLYIFAYPISSLEALVPEVGEVDGFLAYSIDEIKSLNTSISADQCEPNWIQFYTRAIGLVTEQHVEEVALLDESGETIGTMPKSEVHSINTPLHRAFSCFIFNTNGDLLVQQRSHHKKTWPLVWSNTCCGHPYVDESDEDAIARRMREELGWSVTDITLVSPYRYRFQRLGVVENEICPIYIAYSEQGSEPTPNPLEVEAVEWIPWKHFLEQLKQDKTGDEARWSDWCKEEADIIERSAILTHKNTPSSMR